MRRKSEKDYCELASRRNFEWIGEYPDNVRIKTRWRCPHGHEWEATYDNISQGKGCPHCSHHIPRSENRYRSLATGRGFTWVGEFSPRYATTPTRWRCPHGHEWEARFADIQRGRGCPYCAQKVKKTEADYRALAASKGFEWIGEFPSGITKKTRWRCPEGHEWVTSFHSVAKNGCPRCAGMSRRSPADYRNLARDCGFEWVGDYPQNANRKTRWRCPEGHEWVTTYAHIKRWRSCPYCSQKIKKTEDEYRELATSRGFVYLGEYPGSVHKKTRWRCPEGHEWESTFVSIRGGHNCPWCTGRINGVPTSQPQRDLAAMLDGELNYESGKYHIDIALRIDNTPIAIEYNGWHWHRDKADLDAERASDLIADGWHVLYINSSELLPDEDTLTTALIRLTQGETYIQITLSDWGERQ